MGSFSIWHWILVLLVFLLLFGGRGKISELMGDFAQGIKSFKKGMQDEDMAAKGDPKPLVERPPPWIARTDRVDRLPVEPRSAIEAQRFEALILGRSVASSSCAFVIPAHALRDHAHIDLDRRPHGLLSGRAFKD